MHNLMSHTTVETSPGKGHLGSPKRDLGPPTLDRYAAFLARVA